MIVQSFLGNRPGRRIEEYRNSSPRYVKVLAIGDGAEMIVATVNRGRENILTTGRLETDRIREMDEPINGLRPNAVVIVYQRGDEVRFPFKTERTASMLSVVVLEEAGSGTGAESDATLRAIRKIADLFVTTSDAEFVNELVDNLGS